MHNHHKTDGIWIALAVVGFEIMDAQACEAARVARALGRAFGEDTAADYLEAAAYLKAKGDWAWERKIRARTRAKAWERWNRERALDNLGLAMAIVGYLTARDTFWTAPAPTPEEEPTLLAQGDLCDEAAGRLWVRAEARDVGFAS